MVKEAKRRENEFRKELILQAAERVFGKKPYEEASLNDISKESGICLQSIYNLFGSKKNLYKNLILFRIEKFKTSLTQKLKGEKDPIFLLKKWTESFLKTMADFPQFFPVFLKEKFHHEWGVKSSLFSELKTVFQEEEKRLLFLLSKAQKENLLKNVPLEYLKSVFFSFVQSKLEYNIKFKKCLNVEKCVEEILCDFLNGMKH